jgi:hypothetical protein
MISASVAPLSRFSMAMTSVFLLVRSAFGLPAGFFARAPFLVGLASARFVFGCETSGAYAFRSDSVVVFISFLLTGLRS